MTDHQSVAVMIYVLGLMPLILIFAFPISSIIMVLIISGVMFTLISVVWVNYLISVNHLGPLINRINRANEVVWIRVTKDKLLTFQIAKKGVYGQTKSIMHDKKADVMNKGDFPIQCLNGNNAILVYDKMSGNVNMEHAAAWKQLFKKEKVSTGRDAYFKVKKVNDPDVRR